MKRPGHQRYWTWYDENTPLTCKACDVAVDSCECPDWDAMEGETVTKTWCSRCHKAIDDPKDQEDERCPRCDGDDGRPLLMRGATAAPSGSPFVDELKGANYGPDDDIRLTPEELKATREAGNKMLGRPQPKRPPMPERAQALVDEVRQVAQDPVPPFAEATDRVTARKPLDGPTETRVFRSVWLHEPLSADDAAALWAAYNHAVKR